MTTLAELPTSDLILRVSGGSRDGELIPVGSPKCYLGMESTQEAISKKPQCVIFRGREGAVIRSYADQVMFNDTAASLHWLRKGDTIRFPNSIKVEVVQLGELKDKDKSRDSNDSSSQALSKAVNLDNSRLVVLESELRSIQMQNEQSLTRFDQLSSHLSTLTEKMTMLINLSSNGRGVEVSQTNEISTPQESGSLVEKADSTGGPSEEKIINPIENKSWAETPQADTEAVAPQTEMPAQSIEPVQISNAGQFPVGSVEEASADHQASDQETAIKEMVNQITQAAPEEVIRSPVSRSPLEELNRIDQVIEESAKDYFSHTNESDEQILAYDSESAPATEPATASEATIADAFSEKESRISEMERIFGGALSDSETGDDNVTSDTTSLEQPSDPVEPTALDAPLATDSPTQPADEQLSQTFEDLTHGLNAKVDSSADNSLSSDALSEDQMPQTDVLNDSDEEPASESSTDDLESRLSPMALQVLQDIKADQAQDSESTSGSVESETAAAVSNPPVRDEPETNIVFERKENESVSDLLARMKEDGTWSGVPDEDTPVEPVEPVQSTPQPEPMESGLYASPEDGRGEDDVEGYMSQLLSRMRGEEPALAAKAKIEIKEKNEEAKIEAEKPRINAPVDPLKPEEFKPKQKAKKLKSLDAMRELANSNARTNIEVSEVNNRKELAYVQAGIAVIGVLMSLYYFLWSSKSLGDMPSMIGVICLGAATFCGYRYFSTIQQSKTLASTAKPQEQTESA